MEKTEAWNTIVKEQCTIADDFIKLATESLRLQTRIRFLCREAIEYLKKEGFEVSLRDTFSPSLNIYDIYWENSTFGKAKKLKDFVITSQYNNLKSCIKSKEKENPSIISITGINCCYEVIKRIAEDGYDVEFLRNINNPKEIYLVNLKLSEMSKKGTGKITELNKEDTKVG